MKPLFYIFSISTLISFSFISRKDQIKAIPGIGIIINTDTVFIEKTTSKQLVSFLNIEDTFFVGGRISDGVIIETGESVYSTDWVKHITYKEMDFEFSGKSKDSLSLKWIRIRSNKLLFVSVNGLVRLGQINPPIDKYFKKANKHDYISKDRLTYNLYSQGISFQLDKIAFLRKLTEVSIHYRIQERKR